MFRQVLALAFLATLPGCSGQPTVDQGELCLVGTDEAAKTCKAGELMYFQPSRWGNEQLPLNIAAVYCDFNHPVMHTDAGVICVFTDKRLHLLDQPQ